MIFIFLLILTSFYPLLSIYKVTHTHTSWQISSSSTIWRIHIVYTSLSHFKKVHMPWENDFLYQWNEEKKSNCDRFDQWHNRFKHSIYSWSLLIDIFKLQRMLLLIQYSFLLILFFFTWGDCSGIGTNTHAHTDKLSVCLYKFYCCWL